MAVDFLQNDLDKEEEKGTIDLVWCLQSTSYWITSLTVDNIWCFRRNQPCDLLLENPVYLRASAVESAHFPEINQLSLTTESPEK